MTTSTSQPSSALDAEHRSALLATKLAVLVREHGDFGAPASSELRCATSPTPSSDPGAFEPRPFSGGAALLAPASRQGWVLLDHEPERAVGPALAWAGKHEVVDLHLIVDGDDPAGVVARRAAHFAASPSVWRAEGRRLLAVSPAPAPRPAQLDPEAMALAATMEAAGLDVTDDGGDLAGEVMGLEIARVVRVEGGFQIEVGVGRHDREAFGMVHAQLPTPDALASVAATVRTHRSTGAADHPLKRLVPERWLREVLLESPGLVGAVRLERVGSPWPRRSLHETAPAVAAGETADGAGVVAVCSHGIDLDLVPSAADVREMVDPRAELVLVMPERDAYSVTRALAAALARPARVVTVPGDWRG